MKWRVLDVNKETGFSQLLCTIYDYRIIQSIPYYKTIIKTADLSVG